MINNYASTMDMTNLLKRLVESESPSHDKAAVNRLGDLVAEEASRLGAKVDVQPQAKTGDHIIARWGEGKGGILLLSHMDTVFPIGTLVNMPFFEKDGKIFGPGTLDMKGGIVIALNAVAGLRASKQMPHRSITALFTSDEEIGSHTSRALIEDLAKDACLVLVLEPGLLDGSLKTWRKGTGDFKVKVRGRAAHAGSDHEKGCNAIEELAYQIIKIQKMTDYIKGTTLNVGVVRGGTVVNVVPDEAEASVDLRVMQPGEAERITAAMSALEPVLDGTSIEVSGEFNRPPMPFDDTMKAAFEKAQGIAARIGIKLKAGGSGGASDANFVAALGIPVLDGLGAAGEGLHSEREYILASSLPERARLVAALIRDW